MKNTLIAVAAALSISSLSCTVAASPVNLTVKGTITPTACTPSLSNNGEVDIGKISAKTLNQTTYTEVGRPTLQLTVACSTPALFALNAIDNQAGTATTQYFGLGLTNAAEKLGDFIPWIFNVVADGQDADSIMSSDGGINWRATPYLVPAHLISVSSLADTSVPIAVKDLTMDLQVRTFIARADSLTLTDEVTLDGSATLEMKYL